ncbi:MAG: hypothetical protein ACE5GN_01590 [Waddliaceae bacterium]
MARFAPVEKEKLCSERNIIFYHGKSTLSKIARALVLLPGGVAAQNHIGERSQVFI